MLDMSLEELKRYQGCTPRADDFDVYWKRALAELEETPADDVWQESDFQVPNAICYDVFYTGVKGARIHAQVVVPSQVKKEYPALIQFHGYRGNCGQWITKLPYVAAGFIVAALDCRGQGGISEDIGGVKGNTMRGHIIRGLDGDVDNMLMRNIFLDTVQLARILFAMPSVDENKVGAFGVSQGGALAIALAALEPRIAKISTQYPFLSDYKRYLDMDLAKEASEELSDYFRLYDPLHEREKEIFERLSYIDIQNLASRIKGEVQFALTLMDNICPPSTQFAVYNKISTIKETQIFQNFGHEDLPGQEDRRLQFFIRDWIQVKATE